MLNEVGQIIKSHRSIRKYTDQPIPEEVLNDILTAAQWASTSNNFQCYSIIVIKDAEAKKKVFELCEGQLSVEKCPVFLLFCIDFFRISMACQKNDISFNIDQLDYLVVGSVDTSLAVENSYLMAKAHGLGGVMIGAVRKKAEQISELVKLPRYVIPLVGMSLGYPDENPQQKPRLPIRGVAHNEFYHIDNAVSALEEYEGITEDYYAERTNGERSEGWSKTIANYFDTKKRPDIKDFIMRQGYGVK